MLKKHRKLQVGVALGGSKRARSWGQVAILKPSKTSSYRLDIVFSSRSRLEAVLKRKKRERELSPGGPLDPCGAGGERGEGIKNPSQ